MKVLFFLLLATSLFAAKPETHFSYRPQNFIIATKLNIGFENVEEEIKRVIDSYWNSNCLSRNSGDYIEIVIDINGDIYFKLILKEYETDPQYRYLLDNFTVPEFYLITRGGQPLPYRALCGPINIRLHSIDIDDSLCCEAEMYGFFFKNDLFYTDEDIPTPEFIVRAIREEFGLYKNNINYVNGLYEDILYRVK